MRVLVTGITGFVGSHMADLALEKGHEVHGTYRWRSNQENLRHIKDKIKLHECDITDSFAVQKTIEQVRPDYVFHLAAQSYVHASWKEPVQCLDTNIRGEVNLFEAIRNAGLEDCRIQVAGSSEEYGQADCLPKPIKEDEPLLPLSPYGVSKVAQDLLGFQYHQSFGMHIVRTRGFNHTGPRRGEVFVCSNFAKQIVDLERKGGGTIKVGNLEAWRDFTDVRDMVKGYWTALEKGTPGEVYNISQGETYQIKQILEDLVSKTDAPITIEQDPERMRPSDLPVLLGDSSKIRKLGWRPEIPFSKTLDDIMDHWRSK